MVKYIITSISILLLSLLQTSFLSELFGAKYNPNLVLAFALSLVLLGSLEFGTYSGFIGGLMLDFMGVSLFGFSAFLNVSFVLCIFYVRKTFFKGNVSFSIFVFLANFLYLVLINLPRSANFYLYIFPSAITVLFLWVFYAVVKNAYRGFLKSEYSQLNFKNRL